MAESRYEVVPVGWVMSPLTEMAQAPRQADEGAPPAWLVFEADFADAIRDLRPGFGGHRADLARPGGPQRAPHHPAR